MLLGNVFLAVCFVGVPLTVGVKSLGADGSGDWVALTVLFGASNLLDGALACSVLVMGLGLLAHRLVWPAIRRPLYAAHRFRLIERKRLLATAGIALVGVPFPQVIREFLTKLLAVWG